MKLHPTFFMFALFASETSLKSILREQYELSRRAGISLTESDEMADFEREMFMNWLLDDVKRESESGSLNGSGSRGLA